MKLSHGVAAGAEDSKYQAKYRDLKKKVKELEADNDRLHFKVLEARKNVTRMKLERAVLYERLCAVPPTEEETCRGMQDPPINIPQPYYPQADSRDPSVMEYIRNHSRPGGRPSDVVGPPSGHDSNRLRAPTLPFVQDPHEPIRSHSHHNTPPSEHPSNLRSRPRVLESSSMYQHPSFVEPHSRRIDLERLDRERSRRYELHEIDIHPSRAQMPPHSPPHNGSNHPRPAPMTHNRHPEADREHLVTSASERPPNRVPTPPFAQRASYPPLPIYREGGSTTTSRRPSADREVSHELVGPGLHPGVSRSDTPGSARGSGPSRPHSRSQGFEREHPRTSYGFPEGGDDESMIEGGPDARKRIRDDYEQGQSTGPCLPDDRTAKRSHHDEVAEGSKEVSMDAEDA